jgi:hypothetical protein
MMQSLISGGLWRPGLIALLLVLLLVLAVTTLLNHRSARKASQRHDRD